VADLAERWSCSTGKVRTLLAKGELPSFDLGGMVRIPINDVIAYEARCLQQVKPAPAPGSPESPAATLGTSMTPAVASLRDARIARKLRQP
jgi:excisionase family DNA binding protein